MPRFEIKVNHRPHIEVPAFSAEQMHAIGEHAVEVMKDRVATGTDVADKPAPPLKPKYAERKRKQGKQSIRDIQLTGGTLASLQVLEADAQHAKVGISGSQSYKKALFNEIKDPWFGLSDLDDSRVIDETAGPLFAQNIMDALR